MLQHSFDKMRYLCLVKQVDYIIVGLGIAGISFCERLQEAGKSFVVIDGPQPAATTVAGGVVNPVVLKRFTPIWNLPQFFAEAFPFYNKMVERLGVNFLQAVSLLRVLNSVEEQNDWLVASDKLSLSSFLSAEVFKNSNPNVHAPFGYGSVNEVFQINTPLLLDAYGEDLLQKEQLLSEAFEYDELQLDAETGIEYKNYRASKIVFAEGSGAIHNPLFNIECLIPKKGEYIVFKSVELNLDAILKGPIFIIPLGNDLYKAGATFDHHGKSPEITDTGKLQLETAVRKLIHCPFEVVDQMAGMRPTVKDRRPLLGALEHPNVLFYNGLGTRGLGMAPLLSQQLYDYAENNTPLPSEVNITRFQK